MLAWLARFLHLAVRQDRRASAHLAFNMPAVCENRDILPPTAGLWDFHPLGAAALPVEPWHRHYKYCASAQCFGVKPVHAASRLAAAD